MSEQPAIYSLTRRQLYLLIGMATLFMLANIFLIKQNLELKAMILETSGPLHNTSSPTAGRPAELEVGQTLTALNGVDINGQRTSVAYNQDLRKVVFLSFAPDCDVCEENMPNWEALAKGLDNKSYRVVAVSLVPTGVKEYISHYNLGSIPVLASIDSQDRVTYKLRFTPQTILVSPDGKVEKVWTGAIKGERRKELEKSLGIKLPDA